MSQQLGLCQKLQSIYCLPFHFSVQLIAFIYSNLEFLVVV